LIDGLRVLIVDDEPPARMKIRMLLEEAADVIAIHEAADGETGLGVVRTEQPDIVFLDIRMPGIDGVSLAGMLPADGPIIVFVTAYDEHAVRAFDLHAADYLLKPFDRERFNRTMDRVRERISGQRERGDVERLIRLLSAMKPERPALDHLLVNRAGLQRLVTLDRVIRFDATRNNVQVVTRDGQDAVRGTLTELEARLDPTRFVRVNRSQIVCLAAVDAIEPAGHGDADMRLCDGSIVRVSRRYRRRLDEWRLGR
jgi:two-component system LytT family response regulator